MPAPIRNRRIPAGAAQWFADLIDHALGYCDPRQRPASRLQWFAARIVSASAHANAGREIEILERAGALKSEARRR